MSLDYIYKNMRFKINGEQVIWLVGGKVQDVWSVDNLKIENLKQEIVNRMVIMHFLYKEHLIRL